MQYLRFRKRLIRLLFNQIFPDRCVGKAVGKLFIKLLYDGCIAGAELQGEQLHTLVIELLCSDIPGYPIRHIKVDYVSF